MTTGTNYHQNTNMIRKTYGTVLRYSVEKGYGFVSLADDRWHDALISVKEIEPEKKCAKKLFAGDFLEFELHQGPKGFFARNAVILTKEQYDARVDQLQDSRFNR